MNEKGSQGEGAGTCTPAHEISMRLFAGLVVQALLAFLISMAIAECCARIIIGTAKPTNGYSVQFDLKYNLAKSLRMPGAKGTRTMLIIGDSTAEAGIDAELLAESLSNSGNAWDVRNLAVSGATPAISKFLLETAVTAKNVPSVVILSITPQNFQPRYVGAYDWFVKSPIGLYEFSKPSTLSQRLERYLSKYLFMIKYKGFLKEWMTHLQMPLLFTQEALNHRESVGSPLGWIPYFDVYSEVEFNNKYWKSSAWIKREESYWLFKDYNWNNQSVESITNFCRTNNIPLVLVRMPEHPMMMSFYDRLGLSKLFVNELARIAKSSKDNGVSYLDMGAAVPDSTMYENPRHVNVIGGMHFTRKLAEQFMHLQQGSQGCK